MAEIEQLEILIDVLDSFSEELDRLLFKLGQVETAAEAVDPVEIDVDVDGQHELTELNSQLAALQAQDLGDVGDIVLGEKRVDRSHVSRGGGGGISTSQFQRLDDLMSTQVQQLGRVIRDFEADTSGATRTVRHLSDTAEDAADGLLNLDLRMADVHNALAKLIPLLIVFIGAIPAAVGGLMALAAAAGAAAASLIGLTGLAAIGFGLAEGDGDVTEGLGEALDRVVDDFMDAFRPVAERLAPLFEDALDGLDRLFQRIANQSGALLSFTDEARDFGAFLIETIPSFLNDVARFAEAAADALAVVGNRMANVDFFGAMAGVLADALPAMIQLGDVIMDLLPVLFNISLGFLRVATSVLEVLGAVGDILAILPLTQEQFGVFTAAILSAATAIMILRSSIMTGLVTGLVSLGRYILAAIAKLWTYTSANYAAGEAALFLAHSSRLASLAIAGLATGGLALLATQIISVGGFFSNTSSKIDKATESLKAFDRQSRRMSGRNPYANPDLAAGDVGAAARGGTNVVDITVEGDADQQTVESETEKALYRLERPGRKI